MGKAYSVVQCFVFVCPPRRVDGFLEQKDMKKTIPIRNRDFVAFVCFCSQLLSDWGAGGESEIREIREIRGLIP